VHPIAEKLIQSRRDFLTSAASGLGGIALAGLLARESGALRAAAAPEATAAPNPLAPRPPHFAPKAKACIFLFMAGAPSQIDLFDPKPKLNELHGKPLPPSMLESVRFAFIQKESAVLMGSKARFSKHGECGMEISHYLPHIASCADDIALVRTLHTEAFNHHPGQLMMNTGVPTFGRPSMGAWVCYGLGSVSENLPGYVVLSAGRGTSGGTSNWTSGFLPSTYQGVPFRNQGDPVLNLASPDGLPHECQRRGLHALRQLNELQFERTRDPEVLARIASYELAFRMQSAAPELIDLSGEDQETLDMYGVERQEGSKRARDGYRPGVFASFARNCVLARRLVERGVRFVNVYHASWDHHSLLEPELAFNCEMADQPVAALIKDLKRRGMLDETLVVWGSEFGRTPLAENRAGDPDANTGRDHHPFAFSVFLAGGGVKGGRVIGETDELGWAPISDPIHINDFHATILQLFGLDHERLTYRFQGRDFRLTDVAGKVVTKLLA
jgi:hypothetical protein